MLMDENKSVDVLAIGAHPDDVEIGIGGLVHKMTSQGISVAMLDLTRGEMGSRGTPEERTIEGKNAAKILGARERLCADLPDGALRNTTEQQRVIIPFIRHYRPKMILAPMTPDRHPDHAVAHDLVRDANYFSGLAKIETDQERYRCPKVYYFHPYYEEDTPTFIIDISDHIEAKVEALKAHASQFHNPDYEGEKTLISSKAFWDSILTRADYWGSRIQCPQAETLYSDGPAEIALPPGL